jgi:hypothetical protein
MALRPSRLWRELRPEHAVRGRRLAWLAASWLAALHLVTAALVGSSAWAMQVSPIYGGWPAMDGAFWRRVLWRALWPYGGWIEIPVTANSSFANPIRAFIEMGLFPHAAMAVLVLFWAGPLRRGEFGRGHLLRAAVLCMPMAIVTFAVSVTTFGAMALNGPDGGVLGAALMALLLGGIVATLVWWWRCFAVEYLGCRRRMWTLVPLGVVALALTWAAGFCLEELLHA